MRKKPAYDKARIIALVTSGRKSSHSWKQVHAAAAKAGYAGSVKSLKNLLARSVGRQRVVPSAPSSVTRTPGEVEAFINRIVEQRLQARIEAAVAALRKA